MPKAVQDDKSGGLFDYLKVKYKLSNEGKLADFIETLPSVVSEIRHGKREVNEVLLVRICNKTGMSLKKAQVLIAHRGE